MLGIQLLLILTHAAEKRPGILNGKVMYQCPHRCSMVEGDMMLRLEEPKQDPKSSLLASIAAMNPQARVLYSNVYPPLLYLN